MSSYRNDRDDFFGFELFQHVLHQQLCHVEVFGATPKFSCYSGLDLRHVVLVDEVEFTEHLDHLVGVFIAKYSLEAFDLSISFLEVFTLLFAVTQV